MDEELALKVEVIASTCHEANRAYCRTIGDFSQPEWKNAPEWQKASARNGVKFHMANPDMTAKHSHENWLLEKSEAGWSYGPKKDPENKRHPCFVPYHELPIEQQIKDHIFRSVVHGMLSCMNQ